MNVKTSVMTVIMLMWYSKSAKNVLLLVLLVVEVLITVQELLVPVID